MPPTQPLPSLDISGVHTLVFAGGGNRCWWQAGALSVLLDRGWQLPAQLTGTSAGAAVAAACMTGGTQAALEGCLRLYASNECIFDWRGLGRLEMRFAHQRIYPSWLDSFLHAGNFPRLRASGTRLRIGLTRPARLLGLAGSVAIGTAAYIVDKYLWNSLHPRLPRLLGLWQDFVDLHECETVVEAHGILSAAAAAPPFMAARRIGDAIAFDGGYVDNAPIHPQSIQERTGTLVLLTRHYPRLPPLFRHDGRSYWQPSQRIPVSTWDCTRRTTVRESFALGVADMTGALRRGALVAA